MSDNWITVATFHDTVAAAVAKNFLDNEDIPSILLDEATVGTDWMLSTAIGGIKLQVAPLHFERAELLLAQIREAKAEQEADSSEANANAHAHADAQSGAFASAEVAEDLQAEHEDKLPINDLADKLFRSTIFGYIVWPLQAYALFLMYQIAGSEGKVSPKRRWKVWLSVVLNVPIMLIVIVPFLCLESWLPGNAGTPDQPSWRRHGLQQPRISVKFPHRPNYGSGLFDGFAAHDYWAQGKHRVYSVRAIQNYARDRAPLDNKSLAKLIADRALANQLEVLNTADVEHRGISGLEYRLTTRNYQERGRVFNRGNDVIIVFVQSAVDDLAEQEPQRFFDSLGWR